MVNKKSESLFSVTLPDGSELTYPAYFTARYAVSEETQIKMLPLSVGVEEQAFLLVGELLDNIPGLDEIVDKLFAEGIKGLKSGNVVTPAQGLGMLRNAIEKAPGILIKFGEAVCELDEDAVRKKLTLAELVEMITPVIFMEKYRFETSFGAVLENLGYDLDEVDSEEPVEVGDAETSDE